MTDVRVAGEVSINKLIDHYKEKFNEPDDMKKYVIAYVFHLSKLRSFGLTEAQLSDRVKRNNFVEFTDESFVKIMTSQGMLKLFQNDLTKKGISPKDFLSEVNKFFAEINTDSESQKLFQNS